MCQDPHKEDPTAPPITPGQSALPSEPELLLNITVGTLHCIWPELFSRDTHTHHTAKPLLGGFPETFREPSDHLLGLYSSTAKPGL